MKKLHLLCNAHLDPAWLWRWNDGLAEAISTFRVAADFCEKYDGFVFNHNEALLYEWVEEHEPALFERIKKLVADGKWQIMGGWYLQPDCIMPSGESLLSQIDLGKEYFKEKFGVEPKTAVNVDSFGHTRGLVQILNVKGYENYLFMRPDTYKGDFIWKGFDDSTVYLHGMFEAYSSIKGITIDKIKRCVNANRKETDLCLWGIGNHGGGPSKIDLEAINEYIKEMSSDVEIVHSNIDTYFNEMDKENLPVIDKSLGRVMVGCYTSMARVKQANRRVENLIALTEKALSYADINGGIKFDETELKKAKKALAFCQFHDILPGSAIKGAENDALRMLDYAEEIVTKLYNKAFYKLCEGQRKGDLGTIPIMVFNPHPYEVEGDFELCFMLEKQNWNKDEETVGTVYDENGNVYLTQNEKADSTFNMDWPKKICFHAKAAPSSITRFDCKLETFKKADIKKPVYDDLITVKNDKMEVSISKKTGLIELFALDGKELIKKGGLLEVYNDNEDPWGMYVSSFADKVGTFKLMSDKAANEFVGYPNADVPNVRVVEDGDVRVKVQTFWEYNNSKAMIEYIIPKQGKHFDINIILNSAEPTKMIKYSLNTAFKGTPLGQTAFGCEELEGNEEENVFQKWCALKNDDTAVAVFNKGTYGGSFTENSIKLSLLRTAVFSAYPIFEIDGTARQIAPHDRLLEHMDIGERRFSFRISDMDNADRTAQIFNEEPQTLSFWASGNGEKKSSAVVIDNPCVILSSIRKQGDKYLLTLYNSSDEENSATIKIGSKVELSEKFGKYQLKLIEI